MANNVSDEEVLEAVQNSSLHQDFKDVVRVAIEDDISINMLGTLRLLVSDGGSEVEDIENIGNELEEALAKEGIAGVRSNDMFYGANPDSVQQDLFDRVS